MRKPALLMALLCALLLSCGSNSGKGNPDTGGELLDSKVGDVDYVGVDQSTTDLNDAATIPSRIEAIQSDASSAFCNMPFGVEPGADNLFFNDLVVTSPVFPFQKTGIEMDGFYAAEQAGPNHGVLVVHFHDSMPPLEPGAVLDVRAARKEVFCITVLYASSLEISGTEDTLEASEPAIADLSGDQAETWESVLVRVEDVVVSNANPDLVQGSDFGRFVLVGGLWVGNDFSVPYMSPGTDRRKEGDAFASISGIMTWRDGHWILMPRSADDMREPGTDTDGGLDTNKEASSEIGSDSELSDTVGDNSSDWAPGLDTQAPDTVDQQDLQGQDTVPGTDTLADTVGDTGPAEEPMIVINEIMYDPDFNVTDVNGEWFELYNAGTQAVDINGWYVRDLNSNYFPIYYPNPVIIQAKSYLVFVSSEDTSANGGIAAKYFFYSEMLSFVNTSDAMVLYNKYDKVMDRVEFDEAKGWPDCKGASMALINPLADNSKPENWAPATKPYGTTGNKGTPGTANQ